ncbi:succinylglutamate desuccinylase/aspartoacylase family protein [Maribacter halichondriae]|uniref:succinylglutamate desuccinylase/aspartoacylase family protein n=1 Tax=Maribacter halichondriae TaxID=2980554 RepID=UPI0023593991|nr:succinylglutamate desuccinylase/aspartoacylase family protein [Maribacter sp. Hal144]
MLSKTIEVPRTKQLDRLIGKIGDKKEGPTVFFFGGIHGNEMAGVKALDLVFEQLGTETVSIQGNMLGIRGNLPAQIQGKRFIDQDLNRMWTKKNIAEILSKQTSTQNAEEKELFEIYQLVSNCVETHSPPFYFIDLHTTSSKTLPFITINDAMINRSFSSLFPVPIVLGIEEYLEGPLLSHMNQEGYVSLGFESGQHVEESAIDNAVAFIWLVLTYTGVVVPIDHSFKKVYFEQLKNAAQGISDFYEVLHRHALEESDNFQMLPGFESFKEIEKGTLLARHNKKKISTEKDSMLFMPLYQKQGEEGFFLIKQIPIWALKLSKFLRRMRFDNFLTLLPGIRWKDSKKESLEVNVKIARFYAKAIFHLLGYRNHAIDKNHIIMQNRERKAKNSMYTNEWWF